MSRTLLKISGVYGTVRCETVGGTGLYFCYIVDTDKYNPQAAISRLEELYKTASEGLQQLANLGAKKAQEEVKNEN
jgi:hypothetical protein